MFTNTLFISSTPENLYLDLNIPILGGLEAEILTGDICGLCRPFLKWPPLVSVKSVLKIFCFVTSGLQNIHLDIDIQTICGLEADIKIIDTYHILGQPFCKMAAIKVIKMLCVVLMCLKMLYLLQYPKKCIFG